jgi:hypothetical protein
MFAGYVVVAITAWIIRAWVDTQGHGKVVK